MMETNRGCRQVLDLLDRWVDGDLAPATARQIPRHLERCAACREEERRLRELLGRARELPRSVDPPRDLWPAIAARLLPPRPRRSWRRIVAQAVAALVFMAIGGALVELWRPVRRATPPATVAAETVVATMPASLERARGVYQRTAERLERAVALRREELSPVTVAVVERNLRIVGEAMGEIEAALLEDPGNPFLGELLLAQHRREVELLRRLAGASTEA